jgi:class 3 adenylate cyclase/predicted ATPase
MSDIATWLAQRGLEKYAAVFAANEVDFAALPYLTDDDLKELGLPVGPRRKLLAAIGALATAPEASPAEAAVTPARGRGDAERRHLTVMFVDLVGSTALAGRLDPEEMGRVLKAFQNAAAGEITRMEGNVAKYMGDGVLAYFGWPRAHENDAESAVRAGLAINDAIARLPPPAGERLMVRVGIASGLAVVGELIGEGAHQEEAVVGQTPNLAARLQQLAKPGEIVVADTTQRLLGGIFDVTALGPQALKGIGTAIPAYVVGAERTHESRFAMRASGRLLPIVGREQELALLLERWRQAGAGEGQLVLLTGEAGIGKSRVVQALIDAVAGEDQFRVRHQCSPYHMDSALYPAIQQLTLAAGFKADDGNAARLDKLEALLKRSFDPTPEQAHLVAALLGLDGEERYGKLAIGPQQQRVRTLETLLDQLLGLAGRKPVLFVIEDAHWIDPTTLEFVGHCLDAVARARVLILMTARPQFEHGFGGPSIMTRLTLNRLGRDHIATIVSRITGGKALPKPVADEIAIRTDGVPLFVEEMVKAVLESGLLRETDGAYLLDRPLSSLAIPTSLHDSLMARLDRLQPIKEVAQTAATIGREFSYRLLKAILPQSDAELREALDHLVNAELVFRRGVPPDALYSFKHALVRDVAYESLLKTKRQALHERIVTALQDGPAEPEILAHHASAAGLTERAIGYWQQAGSAALARPAYHEAVGHLGHAVRLIGTLGPLPQWQERELQLQIQLGQALIAARGYAAEPTARAFSRAMELADALPAGPLRFPALYGQWVTRYVRGEPSPELAARFVELAEQAQDSGPRLVARRALALERFHAGRFVEARQLIEGILDAYDPVAHRDLALHYGHDARVAALSYKAWILWLLGYPEQSEAASRAAIDWAKERNHGNSTGFALCWGGLIPTILQRRIDRVEQQALHAVEFSGGLALPLWRGWSRIFLGWAQASGGRHEAGLAEIAAGLDEIRAMGARRLLPFLLGLVAEAQSIAGRREDARRAIGEAFAEMAYTQDLAWAAELHRIRGELSLAEPVADVPRAMADLSAALAIAREQAAKLLELRAATSLARLRAAEGDRLAARELLASQCEWFTEGSNAPDIVAARALLRQLA